MLTICLAAYPGVNYPEVPTKGLRFRLGLASVCFFCLAGSFAFKAQAQRGLPAQFGIINFGQVGDKLFRGAQPDALGMTNLAKLGVKLIINLRMTNDLWKPEETLAQVQGILYTNIPMRGLGRPTAEQIQNILNAIEAAPGPAFIHCQHGCDRTGTIIACYRIKHDKWTSDTALQEAVRYGMSSFERGMKRFVADFAKPPKPATVAAATP